MLIDFDNTLFETAHIAAVRPSGLDSSHTIIFTVGQSAVDGGFLVRVPYKTVKKRLEQARLGELFEMVELMDAGKDTGDDDDDEDDDEEDYDPDAYPEPR